MADYTLQLIFDPEQLSSVLQFKIVPTGNSINSPWRQSGQLAGTYNFSSGDILAVEVFAIIDEYDTASFEINDFALVSIPDLTGLAPEAIWHPDQHMSMFSKDKAVVTIPGGVDNWLEKGESKSNNPRTVSYRATRTFPVEPENGKWMISGYLSVTIKIKRDEKERKIKRLYVCDPEGTAGDGGGRD